MTRVSMVSLIGQIFGIAHDRSTKRPVKTDKKQVNWKWFLISWSGTQDFGTGHNLGTG